MYGVFEISPTIFSLGTHSRTFIGLSWRYFMVDIEGCFGSLFSGIPNLFNFNVWTDLQTLASKISWYLGESILPSTRTIFPAPPAATSPQSIMDPPHPFSQNIPSLVVAKKFNFDFANPKRIVPKGLRLLIVWIPQMLNFVLRSQERLLSVACANVACANWVLWSCEPRV